MFDLLLCDASLGLKLKKHNVFNFNDALIFINDLPYGRNQKKEISSILEERRGTCSTKHAFLSVLAAENNLPIQLMLGFYYMSQKNTPQIGNTLYKYGLPFILEGHCYLKYHDQIIDVTFPRIIKSELDFEIINEQEISPFELDNKPFKHKKMLMNWLRENPSYPIQDIEKLWMIREKCILAASI